MERNEEGWFSLWCEKLDLGSALLFTNDDFDEPAFNHVTHILAEEGEVEGLIRKVTEHYRSRRLTPFFYVSPLTRPPTFAQSLESMGFMKYDTMAIMKLEGHEPSKNRGVQVREMNKGTLDAWADAFIRAFYSDPNLVTKVKRPVEKIFTDPHAKLYVAYVDNRPVGTVALYSLNKVGGAYCLGTLPEYRGRGIATALLQTVISESSMQGNEFLCLQVMKQDRVERFYTSKGFRVAFRRTIYASLKE